MSINYNYVQTITMYRYYITKEFQMVHIIFIL